MRCGLFNPRSVRNKSTALNELTLDNSLDILLLCETWLGHDDDDAVISDLCPDGYTFSHRPRKSQKIGGGVGILYKSTYKSELIDSNRYNSFELIESNLQICDKQVYVAVIYRPDPHGCNFRNFLLDFEQYIVNISVNKRYILIGGDFNLHFDKTCDSDVHNFLALLEACNLIVFINGPTHSNGHALDIIITSDSKFVPDGIHVSDPCLSDHYLISFKFTHCMNPGPIKVHVKRRRLRAINRENFKNDIASLPVTSSFNLSEVVDCYNEGAKAVLDNHAPERERSTILRPNTEWYTDELRDAKTLRRRLERHYLKSKSPTDRAAYRIQCNKVCFLAKKLKSNFYSRMVEDCGPDQKKLFTITKKFLKNNKSDNEPLMYSPDELPDKFCSFFTDKIVKIRKTITIFEDTITQCLPLTDQVLSSFQLPSEDEIHKVIVKASSSTCCLDPVPTWLLKECLPQFLPAITHIIIMSLEQANVPSQFKEALIVPILKKESLDPNDLANYRPISNLSFVSKVLERVVADRLNEHLSTNNLLDPFQSAYRSFHSTESALLRVHNDIALALNDRKMVLLALLDMSAAFDTIDHNILLGRLKNRFCIQGNALKWIESYLTNRSQKVFINGKFSNPATIEFGVPQGSVLGPILFTMYVSPMSEIAKRHRIDYHFYADDTQLYLAFDPVKTSTADLEACILDLQNWLSTNFLKLNPKKTELVLFGSSHNLARLSTISLNIENVNIKAVDKVKNLGMYLDSTLSMESFVNEKFKSCSFYLRNIARIRHYLTPSATKLLVHAFVISRIDYGNCLLFGINSSLLRRLQVLQNNAARLIYNQSRSCHATPLLLELHWLPVNQRIIFKILVFVFNCLNNRAPTYLSQLISPYKPNRSLRSASTNLLVTHRSLNRYGDRSFYFAAPRLWNNLPNHIRTAASLSSFKRSLKTYLFIECFNLN